jgi:hypothetical protein
MTTPRPMHPLSYFVTVLSQMTTTLKDFEMSGTASLLEQAKAEIEAKLREEPHKTRTEVTGAWRRESRP